MTLINAHFKRKKSPPYWIFIGPIVATIAIGFPLIAKYPLPIMALLMSLILVLIAALLCSLYYEVKVDRYVQIHDTQLWKKTRNCSLKIRMEAAKEVNSLAVQEPSLARLEQNINKAVFILFVAWTFVFLGVCVLILLSEWKRY